MIYYTKTEKDFEALMEKLELDGYTDIFDDSPTSYEFDVHQPFNIVYENRGVFNREHYLSATKASEFEVFTG